MTEQDYEDEGLLGDGAVMLHIDSAVMGYTDPGILVYSYNKLVDHFVEEGMTLDESHEWISFNVLPLASHQLGFVVLYSPRDDE